MWRHFGRPIRASTDETHADDDDDDDGDDDDDDDHAVMAILGTTAHTTFVISGCLHLSRAVQS